MKPIIEETETVGLLFGLIIGGLIGGMLTSAFFLFMIKTYGC